LAEFKYTPWLFTFLENYDFFIFEWDSGNSLKNEEKHGISIEQIESCFSDTKIMPLGIQVGALTTEELYGIVAKDFKGKILFVCFTIRVGKIRPISGRLGTKKEREIYESQNY
jgi:uncharacterized DUF497 family protein